jgi:chromosome segregation ATPase
MLDAESMCESAQEEIDTLQRQLWASLKLEKELRQLVSDMRNGGSDSDTEGDEEGNKISHSNDGHNGTNGTGGTGGSSGSSGSSVTGRIRDEITALHQTLALKNKHLESAQRELAELATALSQVRDKMVACTKEAEALRAERDSAIVRLEAHNTSMGSLQAELSLAEAAAVAVGAEHDKQWAEVAAEKNSMQAVLRQTEAELSAARENNKKFKDAFAAFSSISSI